jgi:hypothetical protein
VYFVRIRCLTGYTPTVKKVVEIVAHCVFIAPLHRKLIEIRTDGARTARVECCCVLRQMRCAAGLTKHSGKEPDDGRVSISVLPQLEDVTKVPVGSMNTLTA